MEFDESGWAIGPVAPLLPSDAWTLFSPDPDARVDVARWAHQARTFFGASIELLRPKKYSRGVYPVVDEVPMELQDKGRVSRVRVVTVPLSQAPEAKRAADQAVMAIGGAGMDVLVSKAVRVWQVDARVDEGGDPRAPLRLAAILASILLAPIVPPEGGSIFGVKTARERLERG
jgi:hypothetical protein